MQETPRELFERVFGKAAEAEGAVDERRLRQRRSVLDSVVEQYKFYTGSRSPLGAASKARVAEHLERIREYEQRAFAAKSKTFKSALPRSIGAKSKSTSASCLQNKRSARSTRISLKRAWTPG